MSEDKSTISPDWYKNAFAALYPIIYAHRTVEAAQPEALFAAEVLELSSEDMLLDVACGNGRHLAHLAPRVRGSVGLDYSVELLCLAKANLDRLAVLVRADMRAIPFTGCFDAVTNFFTSFGYFFSDDENLMTVRGVAGSLKAGGRFLIDYMNAAYVEDHLVPHSERSNGNWRIAESRWIDSRQRRINKTTVVSRAGVREAELEESVRLYTLEELCALLAAGGLQVERVFGDFTGSALSSSQPRMILAGQKA